LSRAEAALKAESNCTVADPWRQALELEARGEYRRARERFADCLEAPGLDAGDIHFHIACCLDAEGERARAFADYLQAAALAVDAPLVANATYRAALLALGDGEGGEAMSLLQRTREACATSAALAAQTLHAAYWLGVCCEGEGRVLDALALYEEAARSSEPRLQAEARYRRLLGLASIGAFGPAIQVADQLIDSDDRRDDAIARLARLAAEEKRQLILALKEA